MEWQHSPSPSEQAKGGGRVILGGRVSGKYEEVGDRQQYLSETALEMGTRWRRWVPEYWARPVFRGAAAALQLLV